MYTQKQVTVHRAHTEISLNEPETHTHTRSALNRQFWWDLCGPVSSGALLYCLFSCATQWKELRAQKSIHECDFSVVTATHTLLALIQKPWENLQFCFWYWPWQPTKECANHVLNSSCALGKRYAWMQTHRNKKFKLNPCLLYQNTKEFNLKSKKKKGNPQ